MKTLSNRNCQQELRERIQAMRPETRGKWGKMSAPQMVCHLADAFRMYIGSRPVTDESSVLLRTAVKWIALWAPMPWPHGFRSVPELDQERKGTAPTEFARDVNELITLMNQMTALPRNFNWPAHPHFGRLSEGELMRLAYVHTDHHLRQFGG